ncbi:unnamed protein product, partial [Symbiodinium sp. KB8]
MHEHLYSVFCFAEDDWPAQAVSSVVSVNFGSPTATNKVDLSQGLALRDAIGPLATLDEAAPTFTFLEIEDPSAGNDRIVVTFALNEPGTAYCRPTRSDSGETWLDMHINRIVSAAWSSPFSSGVATIEMTSISNRSLDRLDNAALDEAVRYDVYCWAEDDALDGWGMPRPNLMSQEYAGTAVNNASSPAGGFTAGVWVRDSTPPKMIFVRSEAVARSTPTLQ